MKTAVMTLILFALNTHALSIEVPETRILEIKKIVDQFESEKDFKDIPEIVNLRMRGPARTILTPDGPVIVVNPEIFSKFPDVAQSFVYYHELGHVYLKHIEMPYPGPEAALYFEVEADIFASFMYKKFKSEKLIQDVLSWLSNKKASRMISERFVFCENILAKDR